MRYPSRLKVSAWLFLQAGLFSPVLLAAQDTEVKTKANDIERISIVGSNLKRSAQGTVSPVTVFEKADIISTGASSVSELLSRVLPRSDITSGTDGGTFAPGANTVSLRHLGAQNTLILVNGRRYAANAFASLDTSVVSLNSIPLTAIERVEVLYDGAAAIYGSDAVAGVINFVTKTNFNGFSANAQASQWQAGDGERVNFGVAYGLGLLEQDGYNLLLTLDGADRQPTLWSNHQAIKNLDQRALGGADNRFTGMTAGEYRIAGQPRYAPQNCRGSIEPSLTNPADKLCLSNENLYRDSQTSRINANALLTWRLNDQLDLFAETGLSRDDLHFEGWPVSIPTANGVIKPTDKVYKTTLNGTPTNGKNITVHRRLFEAGLSQNSVDSSVWRQVLGVRGSYGDWDFESSALHQLNRSQQLRDRLDTAALANAFKTGSFDPFIENTAAAAQALINKNQFDGKTSLSVVEAKASQSNLFGLSGGDAGVALGSSFSRETAREARNLGNPSTDASRNISSVFAELSLPFVDKLETQLAVRHDRYNDFGSSTNPKLAVAYQLHDDVLIRGSATTTYRAPSLQQLHMAPTGSYWFFNDWARCKPMGLNAANCTGRVDNNNISNKELAPETSINQSLGLVWQLPAQWQLTLDWFSIRQRDTISRLDTQYILDNEDKDAKLAALISRNPLDPDDASRFPGLTKGTIIDVDVPLANIARLETSGVDAQIEGRISLGNYGELNFNNKLSYLLDYKQSDLPDTAATSRLDGIDRSDWQNRAELGWNLHEWQWKLVANTTPGSRDISDITQLETNPDAFVGSYTVVDTNLQYQWSNQWRIGGGVKNLLDKLGPYSTSYGSFLGPDNGRQFYLQLNYDFQ